MKKILVALLVIYALFMSINQAAADNTTCADIGDVYIDQCLTCTPVGLNTNYNTKTRLIVSYHPTKGTARSLLKFDIPSSIEASQIQSAILNLSSSAHTGGSSVAIDIECYALNTPFNEATDTWTSLNGGDYDNSSFATGSLPAGNDWKTTVDVKTLLAEKLSKVRDNGILIKIATEGPDKLYQNVASRECDNASNPDYVEADEPPRLEIVYSLPPSTTTSSTESTTTTSEPVVTTTTTPSGGGGGGGGGGSKSSTTSVVTTTTSIQPTTSTTTAVEPPPETTTTSIEGCTDSDHDGYFAEGEDCGEKDCNDNDNATSPAAEEVCDDGRDNDCDGVFDEDCGVACQIKTLFPQHVRISDGAAIYFIVFGGTGCKTGLGLGQMLASTVEFQGPAGNTGIKSAGSIAAGNIVIGLLQIDGTAVPGVYYVYINSRKTDVSGAALTLME